MSGTDVARCFPDGRCELYDAFEERVAQVWSSLAEWASAWLIESRDDLWGNAHDFIQASIDEPALGLWPRWSNSRR